MRWMLVLVPLAMAGFLLTADAQEPSALARLWPAGVSMPKTMTLYTPTQWAQHQTITNGRDLLRAVHRDTDDHSSNAPTRINPNRLFPWHVSGGMDSVKGWESRKAISIPEGQFIRYWSEHTEAGARRNLPRLNWQFPVGTVTADILTMGGSTFELRTFTKMADGWKGATVWQSGKTPKDYGGAGFKCARCHDHAGTWRAYGCLIRGADNVFSFSAIEEGTLNPRTDIPAKHWDTP